MPSNGTPTKKKRIWHRLLPFLPIFLGISLFLCFCTYAQRLGPFCALARSAPPPPFGVITDGRTVYLYGGPTELLSAREATTGNLLWEKKGLANTLVVHQGVIYAQTGDLKRLTALQARDGKTLWTSSQAIASPPSAPYSLAHSPVVVGETIYGKFGEELGAVRTSDGTLLWKTPIAASSWWLRAADETHVYVTEALNHNLVQVRSLRASDGRLLWTHEQQTLTDAWHPDGMFQITPVGGLLLLQSPTSLFVLETQSGKPRWTFSAYLGQTFSEKSIVARDMVYLATFLEDGGTTIYALRLQDGKPRWKFHASPQGINALLFAEGRLYIEAEALYALWAIDGSVVWKNPQVQFGTMLFARGTIYSDGATLSAVSASTGRLLWKSESAAGGLAAIDESTIYLSTQGRYHCESSWDLRVYALRTIDGSQVWLYRNIHPDE
jgi:outer membrane protein assembly factor BamB